MTKHKNFFLPTIKLQQPTPAAQQKQKTTPLEKIESPEPSSAPTPSTPMLLHSIPTQKSTKTTQSQENISLPLLSTTIPTASQNPDDLLNELDEYFKNPVRGKRRLNQTSQPSVYPYKIKQILEKPRQKEQKTEGTKIQKEISSTPVQQSQIQEKNTTQILSTQNLEQEGELDVEDIFDIALSKKSDDDLEKDLISEVLEESRNKRRTQQPNNAATETQKKRIMDAIQKAKELQKRTDAATKIQQVWKQHQQQSKLKAQQQAIQALLDLEQQENQSRTQLLTEETKDAQQLFLQQLEKLQAVQQAELQRIQEETTKKQNAAATKIQQVWKQHQQQSKFRTQQQATKALLDLEQQAHQSRTQLLTEETEDAQKLLHQQLEVIQAAQQAELQRIQEETTKKQHAAATKIQQVWKQHQQQSKLKAQQQAIQALLDLEQQENQSRTQLLTEETKDAQQLFLQQLEVIQAAQQQEESRNSLENLKTTQEQEFQNLEEKQESARLKLEDALAKGAAEAQQAELQRIQEETTKKQHAAAKTIQQSWNKYKEQLQFKTQQQATKALLNLEQQENQSRTQLSQLLTEETEDAQKLFHQQLEVIQAAQQQTKFLKSLEDLQTEQTEIFQKLTAEQESAHMNLEGTFATETAKAQQSELQRIQEETFQKLKEEQASADQALEDALAIGAAEVQKLKLDVNQKIHNISPSSSTLTQPLIEEPHISFPEDLAEIFPWEALFEKDPPIPNQATSENVNNTQFPPVQEATFNQETSNTIEIEEELQRLLNKQSPLIDEEEENSDIPPVQLVSYLNPYKEPHLTPNCNTEINIKTKHLDEQVLEQLNYLHQQASQNLENSKANKLMELMDFIKKNISNFVDNKPIHTSLQEYLRYGDFANANALLEFIKESGDKELLQEYINIQCSCGARFTALHFAAQHSEYIEFKQKCIELLGQKDNLTSLEYKNCHNLTPEEKYQQYHNWNPVFGIITHYIPPNENTHTQEIREKQPILQQEETPPLILKRERAIFNILKNYMKNTNPAKNSSQQKIYLELLKQFEQNLIQLETQQSTTTTLQNYFKKLIALDINTSEYESEKSNIYQQINLLLVIMQQKPTKLRKNYLSYQDSQKNNFLHYAATSIKERNDLGTYNKISKEVKEFLKNDDTVSKTAKNNQDKKNNIPLNEVKNNQNQTAQDIFNSQVKAIQTTAKNNNQLPGRRSRNVSFSERTPTARRRTKRQGGFY